jgi:exonuclease III
MRKLALKQFVETFFPDVLCLQEICVESRSLLDEAMSEHDHVHDDCPGWTCESKIYWKHCLLKEIEYGTEDIGIEGNRRLFWVRLKLKEQDSTRRSEL